MKFVGYVQYNDLGKQKSLLQEYARKQKHKINSFFEACYSEKDYNVSKLTSFMNSGDVLLIEKLSILGRNMLDSLNIIRELAKKDIKIIFILQPELSIDHSTSKLLIPIYEYLAETEREYISTRTKKGLVAARNNGKLLGRPKGSRNKKGRKLDVAKKDIKKYLKMGLSLNSIRKIVNENFKDPICYATFHQYINTTSDLFCLWEKSDTKNKNKP